MLGYLTYENRRIENNRLTVDFKIPNIEIKVQLENLINMWFEQTNTTRIFT